MFLRDINHVISITSYIMSLGSVTDRHKSRNTSHDNLNEIRYFHQGGDLEYSPMVNEAIAAFNLRSK